MDKATFNSMRHGDTFKFSSQESLQTFLGYGPHGIMTYRTAINCKVHRIRPTIALMRLVSRGPNDRIC